MSIPAIGPITPLTWALEIGEVQHISSIKKAISTAGCAAMEQRSGNSAQRTPLSKLMAVDRGQCHFLVIDNHFLDGTVRFSLRAGPTFARDVPN